MKINFKRVFSLVIALVLMLGTTVNVKDVFAEKEKTETKRSITVNNAESGKTYGAYRIFDLTYQGEGNNKNISYTINSEWEGFFDKGGAGEEYIVNENTNGKLSPIVVKGDLKYINITKDNVAEFAKAAMAEMHSKKKVDTATASNGKAEFTNLPFGYYLVHPQGATEVKEGQASIVSLTSTTPKGEVESKGVYPTITKEATKKSADIGELDAVEFKLKTKVPDTTGYSKYKFDVTDTLSAGLDYVEGSTIVKIDEADVTENKPTVTYDKVRKVLKLSFDMLNLQDKVGQDVVITYKARINKDAVIGNTGNENKVILEYSNNPKNDKDTETTTEKKVKVYTGKITVTKVDANNKDIKLKDAKFVLYKKDKEDSNKIKYYKYTKTDGKVSKVEWVTDIAQATTLESNENGELTFEGLAAGTYFIKETEAPKGYNKLTTDEKVTLTDGSESTEVSMEAESEIKNNSGVELPKTGGNGTKLFALVGGMVILYTSYSLLRGKFKSERR